MGTIDLRIDEHDMSMIYNLITSKVDELIEDEGEGNPIYEICETVNGKGSYRQLLGEHKDFMYKIVTICEDYIKENPECKLKDYVTKIEDYREIGM